MIRKPTYQELENRIKELEENQKSLLGVEDQFKEYERRLSAIVRTVPDIIYRLDPNGKITFVNEAVKKYGYNPDDLLGKDIIDLVIPEHRERAMYKLNERRTGDRSTKAFEIALKAANGKSTDFEINSGAIEEAPVFLIDAEGIYVNGSPNGSTFLGTQGVARDISQRKQAEFELRESEARMASVFRASPAGIGVVVNREFTMVNDRLCQMLGYSRDELMGQSSFMLFLSLEEFERVGREKDYQIKDQGTGTVETQWKCKDGEVIDILLSSSPITPGNQLEGVTFTALDITDTRKVECQLRHSQKMEAIGRLAGGIAHDFNNLLMVFSGNVEIIRAKLPDERSIDSHLDQIAGASDRASALTKQLLAFSRNQMMLIELLDLNQVINGLGDLLKPIIGEDIEIKMMLDKTLGPVRADAGQIEQVVMNLVVNARDAMPRGGQITIRTSYCTLKKDDLWDKSDLQPGQYACLTVSDSGQGMDSRTRSQAFEPFFTTKKSGMGSGLGLSTVYGIVKQSGGDISLTSRPEKGTTFKIFLPVDNSGNQAKAFERTPNKKIHTGSETILVVEDEHMVLGLTERILLHAGYEVLKSDNPEEAIEIFKKEQRRIDLVITDVIMPKFSGKVLADRIQKIKPGIKVLFMSGYTDNAIADQGILVEGTHFIPKPFKSSEFTQKIRKVLNSRD